MAVGFPAKTTYANGDVFSASDINDTNGTLNLAAGAPWAAGKNKIINGAFNVWQRGTSISVPNASTTYVADRFNVQSNFSAGTSTFSQQVLTAGSITGYESAYFGRLTLGSTATYFDMRQYIEDVKTLAGQTVTLSFWAKASASTAVRLYLRQNFGSGGSGNVDLTTDTTITTSWTRYTFTTTLGSTSGKTIGAGNYLGVIISTTGSVTNSQTFDTWGWQVEAGSTATAFQTATGNIEAELAACQRYYFRMGGDSAGNRYGSGSFASSTIGYAAIVMPVTLRVPPTSVDYSTLGIFDFSGTIAVTSAALDQSAKNVTSLDVRVASGGTTFRPFFLAANVSTSSYVALNAEL